MNNGWQIISIISSLRNGMVHRIIKIFLLTSIILMFGDKVCSQNAEELFQRGNALEKEVKYREALVYVDSSLNIDSSLYQRFGFRADIKVQLGMIESAIEDLSRCIRKCDCDSRKAHVSRYYLERAELNFLNNNQSAGMHEKYDREYFIDTLNDSRYFGDIAKWPSWHKKNCNI